MATEFLTAIALVLIIEGIMPGVFPAAWRKSMRAMSEMKDKQIRMIGLGSMLAGAIFLNLLR